MSCPNGDWDEAFSRILAEIEQERAPAGPLAEACKPLQCVSSGYPQRDCSCTASVPFAVASAAWRWELAHSEERGDRFFRFDWRGELWLAYGLEDGPVRGVYCPAHRAEREERTGGRVRSSLGPDPAIRAGHVTLRRLGG